MIKRSACTIALLSLLALSACSSTHPVANLTNLSELQNMTAKNLPDSQTFNSTNIRLEAIKNTALSLGAQGGLAARSQEIDDGYEQESKNLDTIFNFNALMLSSNVLPPVLTEADQSVNVDGPDTLRTADKTYQIEHQAQFVTAAPTWRTYLWMNVQKPTPPDALLLPNNSKERAIWQHYITVGWKEGIQQANTDNNTNIARLKREFKGMVLYKSLLVRGMISAPYVSKAQLGITGGGDHMQINDQVLRIAAKPALQTDANQWNPSIIVGPATQ